MPAQCNPLGMFKHVAFQEIAAGRSKSNNVASPSSVSHTLTEDEFCAGCADSEDNPKFDAIPATDLYIWQPSVPTAE